MVGNRPTKYPLYWGERPGRPAKWQQGTILFWQAADLCWQHPAIFWAEFLNEVAQTRSDKTFKT